MARDYKDPQIVCYETDISRENGCSLCEDGQRSVWTGCGERDGLRVQNYTPGGISATLDASYYKGPGARNGKEREFLAMEIKPVVYPGVGITSPQNGNNPQPNDPAPSSTNDSRNYLVTDGKPQRKYIVRRLTPLEATRLQGLPDDWFDGVDGSDSAKYKALGNGLALPCAYDVMNRIARFVEWENANDNLPCNNSKESQEIP